MSLTLDTEAVARKKDISNPALPAFVKSLAKVWEALTGRVPSVNKVNGGERFPDFVVFVLEVAQIALEPPHDNEFDCHGIELVLPSYSMITTAFDRTVNHEC